MKDTILHYWYKAMEMFLAEDKCSKCRMCLEEKVSYEYEEYESYCLNGKDIYEIEYCFIPLWYSKIKAKLFREKMIKKELDAIAESYGDIAEYFNKLERDKRLNNE